MPKAGNDCESSALADGGQPENDDRRDSWRSGVSTENRMTGEIRTLAANPARQTVARRDRLRHDDGCGADLT